MYYFWDPTMIILIPGLILAVWAQYKVKSAYSKYSRVTSNSGLCGAVLASRLLNDNRVNNVKVETVAGKMTDHYDPRGKAVCLSAEVSAGNSIASLAIAAHETGHALQDNQQYYPLRLRHAVFPMANFGSMLAFPLFFIGFIFNSGFLLEIGILFFVFALAFSLVTLPVEFNASRRAMKLLSAGGYVNSTELPLVRKVLTAAALTYVAATVMALLQLLRMVLLAQSRR